MEYLSVCLCFRNSAHCLAEWLAFYEAIGVDYFYLYNNESADEFEPLVRPYVAAGRAVCWDYPGPGKQAEIYEHCLEQARGWARWLIFCDDDEFLYPIRDVPLSAVLQDYEKFAGVAACWMLYGSSGHQVRPSGLVISNYIRRREGADQHVKCIVDPRRVIRPKLIGHEFETVAGEVIVDENGNPMTGPLHPRPTANVLRINHYVTKSLEEMRHRRSNVQADTGQRSLLSLEQWHDLEQTWNGVEDLSATRYEARVTARIAGRQSR